MLEEQLRDALQRQQSQLVSFQQRSQSVVSGAESQR
jgi:hypothetical protein